MKYHFHNRKGISLIIANLLLLLVVILAVLSFQNWFQLYSSDLFSLSESQDTSALRAQIVAFKGDVLYFKNDAENNLSVQSISIGDQMCTSDLNLSTGLQSLDVTNCTENLSGVQDVVVVTDKGIFDKAVILPEATPSSNEPTPTIPSGELRLYLPLNESSGTTAYDYSGNGYDRGFVSGSPTWQPTIGKQAGSLYFDGNDDVLQGIGIPQGERELTIATWAKPDGPNDRTHRIYNWERRYSHYFIYLDANDGTGEVQAYVKADGQTSIIVNHPTPDDGNWHHYALSITNSSISLYLDGTLVDNTTNTHTNDYADSGGITHYGIGASTYSSNYGTNYKDYFNGSLDEFRLYLRGLSSDEVEDLYLATGGS